MKTRRASRKGRVVRRAGTLVGRAFGLLLKVLLFVGFLAGLGYGVVTYAATSDYFRIKKVSIEGLHVLDEKAVREGCGVTSEDSVIFLRPAEIRTRVEAIPYVRDCSATCVFPDTVAIQITEREAVATVEVGDDFYAVDAEGRILEDLGLDKPRPGPLVGELAGVNAVEPGQTLKTPAYREALAVWNAFSKTEPAQTLRLSEIAAISPNDVQMYFDNAPYMLRWGRGDYETQARRLDVLWKAKGGKLDCRQYVDLRFGQDVICK